VSQVPGGYESVVATLYLLGSEEAELDVATTEK